MALHLSDLDRIPGWTTRCRMVHSTKLYLLALPDGVVEVTKIHLRETIAARADLLPAFNFLVSFKTTMDIYGLMPPATVFNVANVLAMASSIFNT